MTISNAIDVKLKKVPRLLELAALDSPEDLTRSVYFIEAKKTVGRTHRHFSRSPHGPAPTLSASIKKHFRTSPSHLKTIQNSDLLKAENPS